MSLSQEDIIHGLLTDRVKLLAYIRSLVVDRDAAEDLHQEIVIHALRAAASIDDSHHLLSWSRRTAKLKAFEYLRRKRRQPQHLDPDVLELLEPTWVAESADASQTRSAALHFCLQKLTPRSRDFIKLRFADRLNGIQIAKTMGLKVHSVYVTLSRIYHTLDGCMQRKLSAGK